jgi:hypothetical protein
MGNNFKESLKGGFYQMPNALWQYRKDLGLSLEDIAILNCIAFHTKGWAINFKEELSDMSESTRNRRIRSLKEKEYLHTKRKTYKDGNDFVCVGIVCDISVLEEKLIELNNLHQKEEQSNMTENVDMTIKYDRINNTNNNKTNSEEVSIFISSLQERGLEIPRNIGENLINSLSERERQYLQFAGLYIEHEIEYGEWENRGKPLYNSLHTLLNPRRRTHFLKFGEEQLSKQEEEAEKEELKKQMIERATKQQTNLVSLFQRGYLDLNSFKDFLMNKSRTRLYYKGREQYYISAINSFPFQTIDYGLANLFSTILETSKRDESLEGNYRALFRYMASNISSGQEFDFEKYLITFERNNFQKGCI